MHMPAEDVKEAPGELTQVLNTLRDGGERDEEMVVGLYNELRTLARQKMCHESPGHTLQPTALVHEVWLRLVAQNRSKWQNRAHFFAAASEAMRRILVDHARRKQRLKRGGGAEHEPILENTLVLVVPPEELLAVDEAVEQLDREDPQVAELVKLRYYVGMTMEESAAAMGLAPRTAERLWTYGRAWLRDVVRKALTPLDEQPKSAANGWVKLAEPGPELRL